MIMIHDYNSERLRKDTHTQLNGGARQRQARDGQGALDSRDELQPDGCTLRLYQRKDGKLFWLGRGPKPDRRSCCRTITADRDNDAAIGEVEAWLALHWG